MSAETKYKVADSNEAMAAPQTAAKAGGSAAATIGGVIGLLLLGAITAVTAVTLNVVMGMQAPVPVPAPIPAPASAASVAPAPAPVTATLLGQGAGSAFTYTDDVNPCHAAKPKHADPVAEDNYFANQPCLVDSVAQTLEQAAGNVTAGYNGGMDAGDRVPITTPYWQQGLCAVNVHWHLGAEHLSLGQYDEQGTGPKDDKPMRKMLAAAEETREGHQCHFFDESKPEFTTEFDWQHCVGMKVGQTYEVHWPHSAAGACGTPWQFQSPFYDGVFCTPGVISLDPLNTFQKIGVQAQVFTIVNDEAYYYPNLMRGMIVDGNMGQDIAMYTGSTTGTSRSNEVCSRYTPITWQVDRKCHLISASTFDKMCADMKSNPDDMSMDLYAHGSRETVAHEFVANNHQD